MKKEIAAVLMGLAFSASSAIAADGAKQIAEAAKVGASNTGSKIVVVDVEKIYHEAPQIKRGEEGMKKKFGERNQQLKERVEKFNKDMMEFKKNRPTMSKADAEQREKAIMKEQEEIGKVASALQKEHQEFQAQVIKGFQNDLQRAITSVAEEHKADLVLNSAVVLNSNDASTFNVTSAVLSKLK